MFGRNRNLVLLALIFSVLAVFSQWGFFSEGVAAFGFNSAFVLLFFLFVVVVFRGRKNFSFNDWAWISPLVIIGLSFGLYENPWLKYHCVWVLPVLTSFVLSYRVLPLQDGYYFGLDMLLFLMRRSVAPFSGIRKSLAYIQNEVVSQFNGGGNNIVVRISIGVLILIPLATTTLYLLQAADQAFANAISSIIELISNLFSFSLFWKILATASLFLFSISANLVWNTFHGFTSKGENIRQLDSVISGVVVGGIFAIYVLFVYVQIDQLFMGHLPVDFASTVVHVKTGFWQLIFLSVINGVLFLWVYKKTTRSIQSVLRLFIVASGLIVLSAAWRLLLYVYYYGLSYEKFFASYTVIFAILIFIKLALATWSSRRLNIAPKIIFLALWFFSVATVLPVEKIIFHSNIHLAGYKSSRIDLAELTALSLDVGADVVQYRTTGVLPDYQWFRWTMNNLNQQCKRPIYQMNLSSVWNCRALKAFN